MSDQWQPPIICPICVLNHESRPALLDGPSSWQDHFLSHAPRDSIACCAMVSDLANGTPWRFEPRQPPVPGTIP